MKNFLELKDKNTIATIEKGELISFKVDGIEYMHQKGNKGWRNTEIEMFPVIGPTVKNNFKVHTKNGDAIQDQHGLLRELTYSFVSANKNSAKFIKKYTKNTKVLNSKYPKKSTEQYSFWPYDFEFEKEFTLKNSELKIVFTIHSQKGMPFMLGYHPAFLLSNNADEVVVSKEKSANLEDVYKVGHNALPFLNTNQLILKNTDKNHIEITTTGFNDFMLWTEVDNMLCIEPISQYTSYTDQKFSEENMRLSSGKEEFSVTLKVL